MNYSNILNGVILTIFAVFGFAVVLMPAQAIASVGITPSVEKLTVVKNQKIHHSATIFREDSTEEELISVIFPEQMPIEIQGDAQFIFPAGENEYTYQYAVQASEKTGTYSDRIQFLFPSNDVASGPAIQVAVKQVLTVKIVDSENDIINELDLSDQIPEKIYNYIQYKDISFTMGEAMLDEASENVQKNRTVSINIDIKNIDKKDTISSIPAFIQIVKDGEILAERNTSFSGTVLAGETGVFSKNITVPAEDYYTVIVQIGDITKDATNDPVAKKIFLYTLIGSGVIILLSIAMILRLLIRSRRKQNN